MRIFDRYVLAGTWLACAGLVPGSAVALDAQPPAQARQHVEAFTSVKDALRSGVRDYNAGNKVGAVRALEYAADQGHALAIWKLGRMYADGDGVGRNDLKAFEYFSRIADDNADESPDTSRASFIANAFVSLGNYFLDGIKDSYVSANPERAAEMFQYAASYFGDSTAQFSLGRLYLDGTGLDRDERQAARWLHLAAEKGHRPAQALLGKLLFNGQGVPPERARGLAWLGVAKQGADAKRDGWILAMHGEAFAAASENERRAATAMAEELRIRRR